MSSPTLLGQALSRYRVTSGRHFDLDGFRTDDLPDGFSKAEAKPLLRAGTGRLSALQEKLYADARWSLLVVFQAMDAGGKDSTIKHVMSGVNPQGVAVTSFKAPGPQDLAHDFLWRIHAALPPRGSIGIFNRSHYEDVLVARVHPEVLAAAHLPGDLTGADGFWRARLADIAAFEAYLGRQGTAVVKFFLNVGPDEQKKRLLKRLETPAKTWKFDEADLAERERWPAYRKAYAAAIAGTATPEAPWYVIPADRKWYTRLLVAEGIAEALGRLKLDLPHEAASRADLAEARRALLED
jgi:PPK2 family polyphosphate:nucleotide phosphotransferase